MPDTATIWENFGKHLLQFIRRRVEDDAVAEDLLQEVFLRIHARIETLEDQSKIESWIYQIARNVVIDHYRSRRELVQLPENVFSVAMHNGPEPEETLSHSLREMAEALPEPYRQALLLTEYEGLTQAALAAKLGISVSGAKSRVQRAREKIKDALLTCCHFELDRFGHIIDYWEHCCCCAHKH
jgi:RNA polymerase sigma-70 factor (ECF subfamily)